MKQTYSFDDVLLIPQRSNIKSRSEVDIGSNLGEHTFKLPVIASPMDTISGTRMALEMSNQNVSKLTIEMSMKMSIGMLAANS